MMNGDVISAAEWQPDNGEVLSCLITRLSITHISRRDCIVLYRIVVATALHTIVPLTIRPPLHGATVGPTGQRSINMMLLVRHVGLRSVAPMVQLTSGGLIIAYSKHV